MSLDNPLLPRDCPTSLVAQTGHLVPSAHPTVAIPLIKEIIRVGCWWPVSVSVCVVKINVSWLYSKSGRFHHHHGSTADPLNTQFAPTNSWSDACCCAVVNDYYRRLESKYKSPDTAEPRGWKFERMDWVGTIGGKGGRLFWLYISGDEGRGYISPEC
jgi:hypothetical protein